MTVPGEAPTTLCKTTNTFTFTYTYSQTDGYNLFVITAKLADARDLKLADKRT